MWLNKGDKTAKEERRMVALKKGNRLNAKLNSNIL